MAKGKQKGKHNDRRQIKQKQPKPPVVASEDRSRKYGPDIYVERKKSVYDGFELEPSGCKGKTEVRFVLSEKTDIDETRYRSLINRVASEDRPDIRLTGRIEVYVKKRGEKLPDLPLPPGMLRLNLGNTVSGADGVELDFAYKGTLQDLFDHYGKHPNIGWRLSHITNYGK